MQTTSPTYNTILADPNHWFETQVIINGVTYGETQLFSVGTHIEMFQDAPTLGKAVAGEINIKMIKPTASIPNMAMIQPQVRVCNASYQSEWLAQGIYYIDTRETTKNHNGLDVLTLHGYDAMLKAEQMYNGRITGDSTDIQMVNEIAYQMGVSVDARTTALMTNAYTIPFPTGYSYREVLGYIASMYVGCFIMSEVGELRLVSLLELPPETNYLIDEGGDAITFGQVGQTYSDSGSVVSFNNGDGGAFDEFTINIDPQQDLHGQSTPWAAGKGVNFLPPMVDGTYEGNGIKVVVENGVATLSGTSTASGNAVYIPLSKPVTTPLEGFYYHCGNSEANGNLAPTIENSANVTQSVGFVLSPVNRITVKQTGKGGQTYNRIRFYVGNNTTVSGTYAPMFCMDDTPRPFSPYSNVCPISGFSSVNLWIKPTHDTSLSPTKTFSLGQAVYCGTLNPLSGKVYYRPYYASYNGEPLVGEWISSLDGYAVGSTPTTGAQVVDLGGVVFEISITPEELSTLIGQNEVWADSGNVSLQYSVGGEIVRILV